MGPHQVFISVFYITAFLLYIFICGLSREFKFIVLYSLVQQNQAEYFYQYLYEFSTSKVHIEIHRKTGTDQTRIFGINRAKNARDVLKR